MNDTIDTRLVHKTGEKMLPLVEWEKHDGEEWVYIGHPDEFDDTKVDALILTHFGNEDIFIVVDRQNAHSIRSVDAMVMVKSILRNQDVNLWNKKFTRAMEFTQTGMVRIGQTRVESSIE
jgi:hypothetical protein